MTHSSIFSLCKMLQENRTLHTLDISENRLKEESSKVICVALSTNATLCEFRFENAFRSIKKEELNEIKSRIETNVCIYLKYTYLLKYLLTFMIIA